MPTRSVPLPVLYVTRGALAVLWAALFAGVADDPLTGGIGVFLVAYPLLDAVAALIDAAGDHGPDARRVLHADAALSAIAAVGLGVASAGDVEDVLSVFGTWAVVAGLAQLVVALRRRPALGSQWPMLVAGTLSALVGLWYIGQAASDGPTLEPLVAYAAAGGAFFVAQGLILVWRRRRDPEAGRAGDMPAGSA